MNLAAPDLHAHSTFSVLDGLGSPEAVVGRAVDLGWSAACLTEHGSLMSAIRFYKACKENKIKPIIGCEMYVVPDDAFGVRDPSVRQASHHLTVLAISEEGYHNLVTWNNLSNQRENHYYKPRISLGMMEASAPWPLHHNVVLSGCLGSELCQMLVNSNGNGIAAGVMYVDAMKSLFPNFYIELQNHTKKKFLGKGFEAYDQMVERESLARELLVAIAKNSGTSVVLTNDSHFQTASQRRAHVAMKASSWRTRDDDHMGQSKESQIQGYLKDYFYFSSYMQSMERIADATELGQEALANVNGIVEESRLSLSVCDDFRYCVDPSTRILTDSLEWIRADELHHWKGKLWGFDEKPNDGKKAERTRRWQLSEIEKVGTARLPSYRIFFRSGREITVSEGHQWLAFQRDGSRSAVEWRETYDLKVGDKIPRYLDTWEVDDSRDAGWLAGVFDSEGCVSCGGSSGQSLIVSMAQKTGQVLSRAEELISSEWNLRKYQYSITQLSVGGLLSDKLRFLGVIQPGRLIENLKKKLPGARLSKIQVDFVDRIEYVGKKTLVTLQTSTRTFFAEGYGAHNSIPFSGYDDPIDRIRRRAKSRLEKSVSLHGKRARERFEHELASMGDFGHYLLLMSDFIINARRQGILTNTRGSAGNSFLCYCLKIHDIDSIAYGLTFERFYNPSRKRVPDIDIDIEQGRYDDFMQYVLERMTELEGEGQVVPICEYGTLANRASFRYAADALGIEKERQDEIAKLLPQMIDSGMVDEESDVYAALKEEFPELYELASGVFDSIRSVADHPCGWLFGTKDRPISEWVPVLLLPSRGIQVTQFDLHQLESVGLAKGDFLRLKKLSSIKKCLQLAGLDSLKLSDIPLDDEETFEMLRAGRTEGVFTLQGKTNRTGCIECEVENVHDVIRSVAIYRPALTRPGYHRVYNARRKGEEKVEYPHEIAERVFGESYGLPIFQEQILNIGYELGMAHSEVEDFLNAMRKAKGQGRGAKEAFKELRPLFLKKAKKLMTREEAVELWKFVTSFEGYGFNKGHATSYGCLAVRDAYLKRHHPAAFYASLLDVFPEKAKYVAGARSDGFSFVAPCINQSSSGFSLDRNDPDQTEIRVGLARVAGLGPTGVRAIVAGQPYSSLDDFRERVSKSSVKAPTVETLAALGAFDCVGIGATADDLTQFEALGFTLKKPKPLRGKKPKQVSARTSESGWKHLGLVSDVEFTPWKSSVSKLFWIPPINEKTKAGKEKKGQKTLQLKSSMWAHVKTWLLLAVDVNGLPFQIQISEDKLGEAEIVKFLGKKCRGAVVCLNGAIKQPFDTDGPMGFRFYSVAGADRGDTQIWDYSDKRFPKAIEELHRRRRAMKYAA